MTNNYLTAELARVEQELKDHCEAQRIEWQRVAGEGFKSSEDKKVFHDAFSSAANRFAELVDEKGEIKRKLNAT